MRGKTILITGVAGFIGSNLVRKLLELEGTMTIIGLDNLNDYYDIALKDYRLLQLNKLIQDYPEKTGYLSRVILQIKCLLIRFLRVIILRLLLI